MFTYSLLHHCDPKPADEVRHVLTPSCLVDIGGVLVWIYSLRRGGLLLSTQVIIPTCIYTLEHSTNYYRPGRCKVRYDHCIKEHRRGTSGGGNNNCYAERLKCLATYCHLHAKHNEIRRYAVTFATCVAKYDSGKTKFRRVCLNYSSVYENLRYGGIVSHQRYLIYLIYSTEPWGLDTDYTRPELWPWLTGQELRPPTIQQAVTPTTYFYLKNEYNIFYLNKLQKYGSTL
ncbi:hypothetical protein ScPMuIL_012613 [Solemya velum]